MSIRSFIAVTAGRDLAGSIDRFSVRGGWVQQRFGLQLQHDRCWRIAAFLCTILTVIFLSADMHVAVAAQDMRSALADIEQQWARISYQSAAMDERAAFQALSRQTDEIAQQFPGQAEPLAWRGIVLCSYAEAIGGLQALDKVIEARDLFLQAKRIDDHVMNGTVDAYLGTLYHEVPAWPIGFGDEAQAQRYFQRGLAINPGGIDTNYLYGYYLLERGQKTAAQTYLMRAQQVPLRPDHADYDTGRRIDVKEALAKLN
jgi:tetratricopeptide (TPR) repeat protein